MIFTPMRAAGTAVYLANNAGGFDLRHCPDPETLARFIADSCNGAEELQRQLADTQRRLFEANEQHDRLLDAAEKIIANYRSTK